MRVRLQSTEHKDSWCTLRYNTILDYTVTNIVQKPLNKYYL